MITTRIRQAFIPKKDGNGILCRQEMHLAGSRDRASPLLCCYAQVNGTGSKNKGVASFHRNRNWQCCSLVSEFHFCEAWAQATPG